MKKLFKKEWKFYGAAIVLITLVLIGYDIAPEEVWYSDEVAPYELSWWIPSMIRGVYCGDTTIIVIIAIAYVLIKCHHYWNERNSYGRDFKLTLPVKKRAMEGFYLLADMTLVMLPCVLYRVWQYTVAVSDMEKLHVEIPWLWSAMLPLLLADLAYLFMLLAVFRFLEGLIVNGVWKVAGAAAVIALFLLGMLLVESVFPNEEDLTDIVSEFTWDFCMPEDRYTGTGIDTWEIWENAEQELLDKIYNSREEDVSIQFEQLYNGEMSPNLEVLYNEKPLEQSFYAFAEDQWKELGLRENSSAEIAKEAALDWLRYDCEMQEFANYKEIPNVEIAWVRLVLAVSMCILNLWLAGKREASRTIFYFDFVKYMYGLLIGIVILFMGLANTQVMWYKVLVGISAVCAAVLCVYWMTPKDGASFGMNGKKREKNKKYKVEKSC